MRKLNVQLNIKDESGCPFGTKLEEVSAEEKKGIWIVHSENPKEKEKIGKGVTREQAVIDWLFKNKGPDRS